MYSCDCEIKGVYFGKFSRMSLFDKDKQEILPIVIVVGYGKKLMYAIFKIKQNFKKSSNKPNILANIEEKKSNLYLLAKKPIFG